MYEAFYKFSSDPFKMSPDHRFAYPHDSYSKGRNYLEYGLLRGEGLVVITGLPGTGKSTVIEDLLSEYGGSELEVARIQTTQLEVRELLRLVAYSFGINAHNTDKATLLIRLEEYLNQQYDSGRRVLLIIDEAQNLSQQALEELRLLTNVQRENGLHFQIFLLGQPQLQGLIRAPGMEQLRQRIIASCHFEPLDLEDTRNYIQHRLTVAGWENDPQITDRGFELIHRYSGGIPRKINMLTSRLLIHGAVDEKHRLGARELREVITELPPEMLEQGRHAPRNPPRETVRPVAKSSADTVKKYERWQQAYRRPPKATVHPTAAGNEAVDLHAEPGHPASTLSAGASHEAVDTIPILTKRVPEPTGLGAEEAEEALEISPPPARPRPPETDAQPPGSEWPPLKPEPQPAPLTELGLLEDEPRRSGRRPLLMLAILSLILLGGLYASSVWRGEDWRQVLDELPWLESLKTLDISAILSPEGLSQSPVESQSQSLAEGGQPPSPGPESRAETPPPAAPETARLPERPPAAAGEGTEKTRGAEGRQAPATAKPPAPTRPARVVTPLEETVPATPTARPDDTTVAARDPASARSAPPADGMEPTSAPEEKIDGARPGPSSREADTGGEAPLGPAPRPDTGVPRLASRGEAAAPGRATVPTASKVLAGALQASGFVATPWPDGRVKVALLGGVPFAAGQTELNETGRRTLDRLTSILRKHGELTLKVVGHTDQAGIPAYNLHVSRQRAIAVSTYLIEQGIPAARVTWEGRGESEPLVSVTPSRTRASANRRIDIYLAPVGEGKAR